MHVCVHNVSCNISLITCFLWVIQFSTYSARTIYRGMIGDSTYIIKKYVVWQSLKRALFKGLKENHSVKHKRAAETFEKRTTEMNTKICTTAGSLCF